MASSIVVRRPVPADVPALARAHVQSWRETYRGLMRDEVVDDPSAVERRERFWSTVLADDRPDRVAALAERHGVVVGVALAGPPLDVTDAWSRQLYVLYTLAEVHGSGAGAALMDAVLDVEGPVGLWVADPNPRAQAFYRRHGFAPDGRSRVDDGVRAIRMVRLVRMAGPAALAH
ncbi:GNAT family N-acetyltransferase [Cellulomonas carbonis]|uniref:GCN5 family acetyltransferase n=1 Tax=Cellulomonas carbonis T26 TaxID=947969 RepID=A0A0A0BT05_9CELL|nr:GNAT family N-acetyltransferase [Cellulomonas carbonis]KGM10249.1 GCN5 family acetyltransferase [Cellulomonas carbonis T26]GGC01955.1 N-acetyltransferase [Cellulomonas carbonis]